MPTIKTAIVLVRILAWLSLLLGFMAFVLLSLRAVFNMPVGDWGFDVFSFALPWLVLGITVWALMCLFASIGERVERIYAYIASVSASPSAGTVTNQPPR